VPLFANYSTVYALAWENVAAASDVGAASFIVLRLAVSQREARVSHYSLAVTQLLYGIGAKSARTDFGLIVGRVADARTVRRPAGHVRNAPVQIFAQAEAGI
jgi:hypothetical protein